MANRLSKAGLSLGWVSAIDSYGRTMWIVDAHGYGNRFVVHADEKLSAFDYAPRTAHASAYSTTRRPRSKSDRSF